jgi:hypothetical protein
MWYTLLFSLLIVANGSALAQNRPSLTWQGEVTGGATLYIQGNRVDVQGRDTGSVDRPTYRFRDMLPAVDQRVEVRAIRGRGRVEVVEQPTEANQYTAIVDIRNNGRPELYNLQFYWNDDNSMLSSRRGARRGRADAYGTRGRTNDRLGAAAGQVTWSGDVDNEVFISFRGRQAFTTAVRGRDVSNKQADFTAPLPRQNVTVKLLDARGRGQIEVMEQPTSDNGYSAKVRIVDQESGPSPYSFTLAWNGGPDDPNSGSGLLTPGASSAPVYDDRQYGAGSTIRWTGEVDGKIRVNVRGSQVWAQRLSGGPIQDERVSLGAAFPQRGINDIEVRKVSGRGGVEIVQRPSSSNNYTLVFEIDDRDAGPDAYDVEITWR